MMSLRHKYNYVLDIETTMDHKTIRLVGLGSLKTGNLHTSPDAESQMALIGEEDVGIWTWNGARFDKPVLEKIVGKFHKNVKWYDAMHLAQMYDHTDKKKSLDHWAKKLGVGSKSEYSEIDYDNCPIEELRDYLRNDLKITLEVVRKLMSASKFNDKVYKVLQLEHIVAELVQEQVNTGVRFDYEKALILESNLKQDMAMLEMLIEPNLPQWGLPKSKLHYPPKVQFKKNGDLSENIKKYVTKHGGYVAYSHIERKWQVLSQEGEYFDLPLTEPLVTTEKLTCGKMAGIKDWLLSEGWTPTEWNYNKEGTRTGPRLTAKESREPCPNLSKMGQSWVKDYADWLTARSRLNVLKSDKGTGWINDARHDPVEDAYFLPSDADSMGANTGRFTHKGIANVPRVTSAYGREIRELFCARDGMVWVGWDASALEARVEAHYCHPFDPAYAEELVEGDVHQRNLDLLPELGDRDRAKTFKYAITYGAQPAKLAASLGFSKTQAQIIFDDFWENNRALRQVKKYTEMEWELNDKQYIIGLDGRPISTRSKHSLVNARFQSAGAIIMKYAMIIANKKIRQEFDEWVAYGLIRYHDEEVWECLPELAERVAEIGEASVEAAGKYLKLNVPLKAEAKIGNSWAEVH